MKIRVIANAHAVGGGEFSSAHLMRMLGADGHDVTFHPATQVSPHYPRPWGITIGSPYAGAHDTAIASDLLLLYANDLVYKLNQHRQHWTRFIDQTRRFVMVINFVMGEAKEEWFASRIHTAIFLNSTKRDEFVAKAKGFAGNTIVLPPPVDLAPFLQVQPNYSRLTFVRHSRYHGKYDTEDTNQLIDAFLARSPASEMWFMAAPPFLAARKDPRLHLLRWSELPPPEFLSKGSVFWYRLPASMRDQGPRVVVEAMAAGLPCIVDNRDGARDRVTPETGWLCDKNADYVAAVEEILRDPTMLERKGRAARERAVNQFQPEKWIEAILGTSSSPRDVVGPPAREPKP